MTTRTDEIHKLREMLAVNERQSVFYEAARRGNLLTRLWRTAQLAQKSVRIGLGVDSEVYEKHWEWIGDLSGKRVLDLGCYEGNALSVSLAERAGRYLGVDLSRPAIEKLREKLRARGLQHAEARAIDFLSPEFPETDFDVVYAHSVVHHFRHLDAFLSVLSKRLRPGGTVVTLDPLQTDLAVRTARALYRPFQSDSAWEWPFTKSTFDAIEKHFEIVAIQGIMGHAKWSLPIALVNRDLAVRVGRHLHARDRVHAVRRDRGLWRCLQVSMCWKKPAAAG